MNDKFLTLLGFAAKAGRLSFGMDACTAAIKANKTKLALVCSDISAKSRKEIAYFCDKYNAEHICLGDYDIQAVTTAVGRKCGILSVNDSSFADAIKKALAQGGIANDK